MSVITTSPRAATSPRTTSSSRPANVTPTAAVCGGTAAPVRTRSLRAVADAAILPTTVGAAALVPTVRGPLPYGNLDHAASTPALTVVHDAVERVLATYSSVHRGAGHHSRVTSAFYEQARTEVARFVGARAEDHVIFTRSTTDSWNLLAKALPSRTTVFVFGTEHHSTLLPWGRGRTIRLAVPASVSDALALLDEALSEHPAKNRLVVITAASNVTGETWPVEQFAQVAHSHGARLAVDAAQLAPHRPVDLAAWDADYVAFSGHKVYAPYGAGVLAGRADWLDAGTPYLVGGGATASVTPEATHFSVGPARHEGGSPNVVGAVALAAACATIERHRDAVEDHESALLARLRAGLATVAGIEVLSVFDDAADRVGVLAFTVAGFDSAFISQYLSAEHGIGVRDGKFCAHLLVDELLDDPWNERPATAVRASLGLATTLESVDRLVAALAALVADGPAREWRRVDGAWVIEGDDPRDAPVVRPW